MEVDFESDELARVMASETLLRRKFGQPLARRLMARVAALRAVDCASDLFLLPGRWHVLKGDWKGHLSGDLVHPLRLLVRPRDRRPPGSDGGVDWAATTAVTVVGVVDTH